MGKRKRPSTDTEKKVLVMSARRCCICFGLNSDYHIKQGQIAHLDHNPSNSNFENLAWMCLPHHDEYDSKTRQSKGMTRAEVLHYREQLYRRVKSERSKRTRLIGAKKKSEHRQVRTPSQLSESKNSTGATIARKMHLMCNTLCDSFKDLTYQGFLPQEVGESSQPNLLKRFDGMAKVFQEFYTQGRELKPFLDSGDEIEDHMEAISRLLQFYKMDLLIYHQQLQFAQEHVRSGLDLPQPLSQQLNEAAERALGSGRQKTLDSLGQQLRLLKRILADYIRKNTG